MSKARTPNESLEAIDGTKLYPLPTLQRVAGFGNAAFHSARRKGLPVRYMGNRCYVYGQHFIDYVLTQSGEKQRGAEQ